MPETMTALLTTKGILVQQVTKLTNLGKDRRKSAIAHYVEQAADLLVSVVS